MSRITTQKLREILKVYFIMGSNNCLEEPETTLTQAIDGGITCFQFREKGKGALTGLDKYELAEKLLYICRKANVPFIVNDDIDLAISIQADGVHIGQEDENAQTVKEKIGNKIILGISVHNLSEAEMAIKAGADYFGVGPIYPTSTKADIRSVQGVKILQELRANGITIPIVGIGGITANNAYEVIEAGADGVSVISAISKHKDPKLATSLLKENVFSTIKI